MNSHRMEMNERQDHKFSNNSNWNLNSSRYSMKFEKFFAVRCRMLRHCVKMIIVQIQNS